MDANLTPGKVKEDPFETMYQEYKNSQETYDMNGACVPDSKEAGGNLAAIQDNIRDRFCLDTQDSFGYDKGDKKLY